MVDTLVALAVVLEVEEIELFAERDEVPMRLKGGRKKKAVEPAGE